LKKALVITYYWPPSGGSGVQRWVKFSKYLPAENWCTVVYTPENPEFSSIDKSLEGDIPETTTVIKRPIREYYSIYRKLLGKSGSSGTVNPISQKQDSFKKRFMVSVRGNCFIPDPRVTWVAPSVKFLKKYLKENPVDVIVSTGPPHSMHLIARKVAEDTGIPWIADFRDPWTKMFYFKHLHLSHRSEMKHKLLEKSVLDEASAVVAVSPLVQKEFQEMTSTPVELITNGYDPEDFAQVVEQDGYFNVTHTGLFAEDGNPETLWKALANKAIMDKDFAEALRIRLCGKTDAQIIESIKAAGLGEHLVDLGYQNHITAVREQKNAAMLILPLRKEPEYKATLPGKLFEYLASLKPIMGIGQTDGAMAKILGETKAGRTFEWNDYQGISDFLDKCWDMFSKGEEWNKTENIEKYSRKSTAAAMANLMNSLTK